MKAKDIFKISGVVTMLQNGGLYLTDGNCNIKKASVFEDRVDLILRHESVDMEGSASIHVKDEYKNNEKELLLLIGENDLIIGLTLGELRELEIDTKSVIK